MILRLDPRQVEVNAGPAFIPSIVIKWFARSDSFANAIGEGFIVLAHAFAFEDDSKLCAAFTACCIVPFGSGGDLQFAD